MLSSLSSDKHISPTQRWWRPLTHHTYWYSFIWSFECTIKRWRGRIGWEMELKWIKFNEFPWSLCNRPSNTRCCHFFFFNKKWLDNYSARPHDNMVIIILYVFHLFFIFYAVFFHQWCEFRISFFIAVVIMMSMGRLCSADFCGDGNDGPQ